MSSIPGGRGIDLMFEEAIMVAAITASTSGTMPEHLQLEPQEPVYDFVYAPQSVGTRLGFVLNIADTPAAPETSYVFAPRPQHGWLEEWRRPLSEFRRLPLGWDGAHAKPPNGLATGHALDVLEEFWEIGVKPTRIAPTVEDGILVELRSPLGGFA